MDENGAGTLPRLDRRRILATACSLSPALALGSGLPLFQERQTTPASRELTTEDHPICSRRLSHAEPYHCRADAISGVATLDDGSTEIKIITIVIFCIYPCIF